MLQKAIFLIIFHLDFYLDWKMMKGSVEENRENFIEMTGKIQKTIKFCEITRQGLKENYF
jgi:hypothetical protein